MSGQNNTTKIQSCQPVNRPTLHNLKQNPVNLQMSQKLRFRASPRDDSPESRAPYGIIAVPRPSAGAPFSDSGNLPSPSAGAPFSGSADAHTALRRSAFPGAPARSHRSPQERLSEGSGNLPSPSAGAPFQGLRHAHTALRRSAFTKGFRYTKALRRSAFPGAPARSHRSPQECLYKGFGTRRPSAGAPFKGFQGTLSRGKRPLANLNKPPLPACGEGSGGGSTSRSKRYLIKPI